VGIFDSIKKSLAGSDQEAMTPAMEALEEGPSEEGLEARLENDYEDHVTGLEKDDTAVPQEAFVLEDVYVSDESLKITEEAAPAETEQYVQESPAQDWSWQEVAAQKEAAAAAEQATQEPEYVAQVEATESSYGENTMDNEVTTPVENQEAQEESKKGTTLSHISEEAVVRGDITTGGHLEVLGRVKGNIEAEGNVAVQGNIKGNIAGSKIGLYRCKIKGNLDASVGVVADTDALIIGDVKTQSIILDGRLKGDIDAENVVVIKENGYYLGDIVTGSISIENGAIINGHVQTLIEGDIEAPFED
jgi:cytoskeletal protein CcmA (bactofilin family)